MKLGRNYARSLFQAWSSLLFPPLCRVCKEPCDTSFFCPSCWEECSLPDPALRCRHCFEETEEEICERCRKEAKLPFASAFVFESSPAAAHLCSILAKEDPESLAAFALVQWNRLDWPMPDAVIPLPNAYRIAREFSTRLGPPCFNVLHSWNEYWTCDIEVMEENACLLMLCVSNSWADVAHAISAISGVFPKKIFILSLRPLILDFGQSPVICC